MKDEPVIWSKKQLEEHHDEQAKLWINYLKNTGNELTLRKVQSEEGQVGIMIVNSENEEDIEQNVILKIGKGTITATNCKIAQKPWKVEKPNMKGIKDVYKIVRDLETKSAQELEIEVTKYGMKSGTYASMGSTLGKCLAHMN